MSMSALAMAALPAAALPPAAPVALHCAGIGERGQDVTLLVRLGDADDAGFSLGIEGLGEGPEHAIAYRRTLRTAIPAPGADRRWFEHYVVRTERRNLDLRFDRYMFGAEAVAGFDLRLATIDVFEGQSAIGLCSSVSAGGGPPALSAARLETDLQLHATRGTPGTISFPTELSYRCTMVDRRGRRGTGSLVIPQGAAREIRYVENRPGQPPRSVTWGGYIASFTYPPNRTTIYGRLSSSDQSGLSSGELIDPSGIGWLSSQRWRERGVQSLADMDDWTRGRCVLVPPPRAARRSPDRQEPAR